MISSWDFASDNYGIVLSGGGGKGTYQVGVLKYLSEIGFFEHGPSYVGGVSVGSINAAAVAQHSKEDFNLSIDNLEKFWLEDVTATSDILHFRFPRYLAGFWKLSLGKATKLEKILQKRIDVDKVRKSNVKLEISAVNIRNGKIKNFDNTDPFLIQGILASAAYPFAFPPVKIEDSIYIDGGVRDLAPLKRAIKHGVDNIVCISTDHTAEEMQDMKLSNVFDVGRNLIRICSANNFQNDIDKLIKINNKISKGGKLPRRRPIGFMCFKPSKPLGDTFDFSKEKNLWRMALGYEDAKNMLSGEV